MVVLLGVFSLGVIVGSCIRGFIMARRMAEMERRLRWHQDYIRTGGN